MPAKVKPIPDGYSTITPYLCVRDAARALDFYKRAFGATNVHTMPTPDGKIMHAEFKIGDSMVMLSDEFPQSSCRSPQALGGTTTNLHVYVEDVDRFFSQAVAAGAKVEMPVTDMFWGDRYGKLLDPFGHSWAIGTHMKDVAPEEMQAAAASMFSSMSQKAKGGTGS